MAVTEDYRTFLEEQLGRVTPVTTRRMFGGLGVYAHDLFFALADDNAVYFKAGAANLSDFEARGCQPFRPYGDDRAMRYYEVPGDVLEDVELLEAWMDKAIAVGAATAKAAPPRPLARRLRSQPAHRADALPT
jgi:DNA transformation protein and related proteins